jgi:hypothetical protein
MKTQPELQAVPMSHDPCYTDNQEALPDLQVYAFGEAAADRRHDHILRAALLTKGCTIRKETVETH